MKTLMNVALMLALVLFASVANAATVDIRKGGTTVWPGAGEPVTMEFRINFDDISLTTTTDVIQIANVPAGTLVTAVHAYVDTASTGTSMTAGTIDLGDADDADGYVDGMDITVAGTKACSKNATFNSSAVASPAYGRDRYYASTGVISGTLALTGAVATEGLLIVKITGVNYVDP